MTQFLNVTMVNGNYVLYGDRPSSESEIVEDHVHTRERDRKNKRKVNRTANELQHSLNLAQLDNETDSVKYEKKVKEPKLLRYVPTTDVEENFVAEKFETNDLKPSEERTRRYAFTKKPKNPADGSVNYAYSRSSSSCSSPSGNLPTISEHGEQYGTYHVRAIASPEYERYDHKLNKYFAKPRDVKPFAAKGSHPDSLYRVAADEGQVGGRVGKMLRVMRWPTALVAVCVALALFVYFLMPDKMDMKSMNGTYWESEESSLKRQIDHVTEMSKQREITRQQTPEYGNHGSKPVEIDFYEADKIPDLNSNPKRNLPVPPVFPTHLSPEVQYGNEKADTDKLRTPKFLEDINVLPVDSTLKPHITQKPEKPLAIYFKEASEATTTTESITRAETVNDFTNYDQKLFSKKVEASVSPSKTHTSAHKPYAVPTYQVTEENSETEPSPWLEDQKIEDYYKETPKDNVKFTSGHSKLFGISIEDAENMKSTTQSSLYNTRVSPTLPTWRDGDDTTTKKYPTNTYSDVQCRSTRMSICRGVLPYDLAGAPFKIKGVEITSLLPQIDYLISTNCSERVRHFVCALLEPECNPPPYPSKMPCQDLCRAVVDNCAGQIPRELLPAFDCKFYLSHNCIAAKTPCYPREFTCGDGSCIPRDWMCDGNKDCPEGEEEATCAQCGRNEYRCSSGTCIQKQWMCDGYADCPDGEDEREARCEHLVAEHEHELASGSAPAPAVSRPGLKHKRPTHKYVVPDTDGSKELLEVSDSTNALKRNFTRRPSPSRLTPYTRPRPRTTTEAEHTEKDHTEETTTEVLSQDIKKITSTHKVEKESMEDINMEDLGLIHDADEKDSVTKTTKTDTQHKREPTKNKETSTKTPDNKSMFKLHGIGGNRPRTYTTSPKSAGFDRRIDTASLLKKAMETEQEATTGYTDDNEDSASMSKDGDEISPALRAGLNLLRGGAQGARAHASPCPSGELRCVDGLCITLAQLCDGTIDCSDHADEDNCYS